MKYLEFGLVKSQREICLIASGVAIGVGTCIALYKIFSKRERPCLLKIITNSDQDSNGGTEDLDLPISLEREFGNFKQTCKNIDPKACYYLKYIPEDFYSFDEKLLAFSSKHFAAENGNLSQYRRLLLIGSGVGALAFELSKYFHEVKALEKSFSKVVHSHKYLNNPDVTFEFPLEGSLRSYNQISTIHHKRSNKIFPFSTGKENFAGLKFINCDASNLPINLGEFQTAIITSELNELDNPEELLRSIHRVIETNGILIIATDYNWKRFTNKKLSFSNSTIKTSFEFLKEALKQYFDFIDECNIVDIIGLSLRSCRISNHHVTAWKRNNKAVILVES